MLEKEKKKSLIVSSCERHSKGTVSIHISELRRFLLATAFSHLTGVMGSWA